MAGQPGDFPCSFVSVDNAFGRRLVNDGNGCLESFHGKLSIVGGDGLFDSLDHILHARFACPVALTTLLTLPRPLQCRFVICQVLNLLNIGIGELVL
jgi:hypothetical protein